MKKKSEKRLAKSLSETMKDVKPIFSIAIEMDEKFKNTDIIKEKSSNILKLKKDILKHLDTNKEGIITFDPFSKIKLKENTKNKNDMQPVPKWAVSLKKQVEEGSVSDEEDDDEDEGKFNAKFYRKLSRSKEDMNFQYNNNKSEENSNDINNINNEDDSNESDEEDDDEKYEYPYKKYIQNLFYPKLNDFRKDIIEDCFKNKKTFGKIDFQKFICLLEFFISLFSGIQVKYSID